MLSTSGFIFIVMWAVALVLPATTVSTCSLLWAVTRRHAKATKLFAWAWIVLLALVGLGLTLSVLWINTQVLTQ